MDVWQIIIIGGAAFLAVRSLVDLAVAHEKRFRGDRKRKLKAKSEKKLDRTTAEQADAA